MSWEDRKHIFTPGARYRVRSDAPGSVERRARGEIWIFVELTYSRYDGLFVYTFRNEADGAGRSWALRDEEVEESWREVFALAGD